MECQIAQNHAVQDLPFVRAAYIMDGDETSISPDLDSNQNGETREYNQKACNESRRGSISSDDEFPSVLDPEFIPLAEELLAKWDSEPAGAKNLGRPSPPSITHGSSSSPKRIKLPGIGKIFAIVSDVTNGLTTPNKSKVVDTSRPSPSTSILTKANPDTQNSQHESGICAVSTRGTILSHDESTESQQMDRNSDAMQYFQQPAKRAREEGTKVSSHERRAILGAKRRKNGYEVSESTAGGRAGCEDIVEVAGRSNENVESTSEWMLADNESGVFEVNRIHARWRGRFFLEWADGTTGWEPRKNINEAMVAEFEANYHGFDTGIDVLKSRMKAGKPQYLVHWHGQQPCYNTWVSGKLMSSKRLQGVKV